MSSSDEDGSYLQVTKKLKCMKEQFTSEKVEIDESNSSSDELKLVITSSDQTKKNSEKEEGCVVKNKSKKRTTRNSCKAALNSPETLISKQAPEIVLPQRNTPKAKTVRANQPKKKTPKRQNRKRRNNLLGRIVQNMAQSQVGNENVIHVGNCHEYLEPQDSAPLFSVMHLPKPKGDEEFISQAFEECEQINVKIVWQSNSVHSVKMRKFQRFTDVFKFFSKKQNIPVDNILFTLGDKMIHQFDSPDSIGYTPTNFIDAGVLDTDTKQLKRSSNKANGITVKFQLANRKQPFESNIQKFEQMKIAMAECSEHLNIPMDKLKFTFDGESLSPLLKPSDLELEGGEIIDVVILDS